eukprot:4847406-Pleurochrysis_carterae.AAC.1
MPACVRVCVCACVRVRAAGVTADEPSKAAALPPRLQHAVAVAARMALQPRKTMSAFECSLSDGAFGFDVTLSGFDGWLRLTHSHPFSTTLSTVQDVVAVRRRPFFSNLESCVDKGGEGQSKPIRTYPKHLPLNEAESLIEARELLRGTLT